MPFVCMLAKFVLRSCCRTSLSSLEIAIKSFFIEKVISSTGTKFIVWVGDGLSASSVLLQAPCVASEKVTSY